MVDRFFDSVLAVGAIGSVGTFDSVEDDVEWDVASSELGEDASLVASKLVDDMEVVVRGEGYVYRFRACVSRGGGPIYFPFAFHLFLHKLACGRDAHREGFVSE